MNKGAENDGTEGRTPRMFEETIPPVEPVEEALLPKVIHSSSNQTKNVQVIEELMGDPA